jgi:hypothetical protein
MKEVGGWKEYERRYESKSVKCKCECKCLYVSADSWGKSKSPVEDQRSRVEGNEADRQ